MVEETMRRIVTDIAAAEGCTAELEYSYLEPSVVNGDPELTKIAREAAEKLYGPGAWAEAKKAGGSEDFSYVMDHIPSSMFAFLGCYDENDKDIYPLHNGKFRVNEKILKKLRSTRSLPQIIWRKREEKSDESTGTCKRTGSICDRVPPPSP